MQRGKHAKSTGKGKEPPPGLQVPLIVSAVEPLIEEHARSVEAETEKYERLVWEAMKEMTQLIKQKETQEQAEYRADELRCQAMEKVEELEVQLSKAQLAQMHAIQVSEQADAATSATRTAIMALAVKMSSYKSQLDELNVPGTNQRL